jgi:hypothetical protein
MKAGPLVPLGLLLAVQYFGFAILVSTYKEKLYFPGVRIVALHVFLLFDVAGYILWRALIRPHFSALRDLPKPPVCYTNLQVLIGLTSSRHEVAF